MSIQGLKILPVAVIGKIFTYLKKYDTIMYTLPIHRFRFLDDIFCKGLISATDLEDMLSDEREVKIWKQDHVMCLNLHSSFLHPPCKNEVELDEYLLLVAAKNATRSNSESFYLLCLVLFNACL